MRSRHDGDRRQDNGKGQNGNGRHDDGKGQNGDGRQDDGDGGSVAANIDIYLVSEKWYFFLQLRLGPTYLLLVVPRNDAIFPKLHTNRH